MTTIQIPPPIGHHRTDSAVAKLCAAIRALAPGQALVWTGNHVEYPYRAGRMAGLRVRTEKQRDGTRLIWVTGKL